MRLDGRIDPARIGGPGAAVGDTLVWDGMRWMPAAAPAASCLAVVDTDEPTSPLTGLFWYDPDDNC